MLWHTKYQRWSLTQQQQQAGSLSLPRTSSVWRQGGRSKGALGIDIGVYFYRQFGVVELRSDIPKMGFIKGVNK